MNVSASTRRVFIEDVSLSKETDMSKKLTLNLSEETVQRAEHISKRKGKSISLLVEELLNSIPEKDEAQDTSEIK